MYNDPHHIRPISDAFLASIVASSNDAIISKDLDGTVMTWNPAAERLFGYTAGEAIGRSILFLFPPDRVGEEDAIMRRIVGGERISHFHTVRRHKSGALIDISLNVSSIRDRSGTIIGVSKIARDIGEQIRNEEKLRAAQAKLEGHAHDLERVVAERTARLQEMVAELESFSYSLSHDLRAPLRAIQGFTEIVLTEYGDRIPEGVDYLRRVSTAATRMDKLIHDVLAFSRVAREDIEITPVDLDSVVHDLVHERPELRPPHATVEVAGRLLPVLGHGSSLTQCLANLLDNAVKFVPPNVPPRVNISTRAMGSRVRIEVRDNGIGISPADQARLFVMFQRVATPQSYEGTGLGLAIVRKAAERMGGSVGVESAPGEGSTFWVDLPAASTPAGPEARVAT